MRLPFVGFMPSDVIAAWVFVLVTGGFITYYVLKKRKLPLIWEYMTTTNHRKIGTLYLLTGFVFFLRGGIDALLIRSQLALPNNHFWVMQQEKYNEVFTTHGTIMIFFAAMPMILGLMNIAVPLQIGARDLAFPYLNSIGYWLFFAGGVFFNLSFFFNKAPAVGWTAYAPLSTEFTPGINTDFYVFGVQISGLGTILTAINLIVTIIRHRAPGMTLKRMPLFPWATLITSWLILVAFTVLAIGLYLMTFERLFGAQFFSGNEGDPVFWQHLFWIFGHPEVYILALPAFGIFSDIITTFSKKSIFGYPAMVISLALIGFLGFMVWSHHMFTVGLGAMANTFFALTTMAIAVPTGIKIFNWLFTMRGGKLAFTTPMLFAIAFIPSFVIGGVTGVMLSVSAADFQYHDTHFVVAHFHYVIISSTVFGIFAGIYYWFPKMTGYMLDEKLGKWHFWLFVFGFHMTFLPMHLTGLNGMPRRVYTYGSEDGLTLLNFTSTVGAFLMGISMLFLLWNLWKTFRYKVPAGNDPWDGRTLEWTVPSPAPEKTFDPMPIVTGPDPLWYAKQSGKPLATTKNVRPAPPETASVIPFLTGMLLIGFSFGMTLHWWWLAALSGAAIFGLMAVRSLVDERAGLYRKKEAAR